MRKPKYGGNNGFCPLCGKFITPERRFFKRIGIVTKSECYVVEKECPDCGIWFRDITNYVPVGHSEPKEKIYVR